MKNNKPEGTRARKEWCCIIDAARGFPIRATSAADRLWTMTPAGAIRHEQSVVEALAKKGLLKKGPRGTYVRGHGVIYEVEFSDDEKPRARSKEVTDR